MYCSECGSPLKTNAQFCGECGALVAQSEQESADPIGNSYASQRTEQQNTFPKELPKGTTHLIGAVILIVIGYVVYSQFLKPDAARPLASMGQESNDLADRQTAAKRDPRQIEPTTAAPPPVPRPGRTDGETAIETLGPDQMAIFARADQQVQDARLRGATADNTRRGNRKLARRANERGLTYLKAAQVAEAVTAFQEANRADPSDVEIVNNLGYALLLNHDLDAALRYVLASLDMKTERSAGWGNLGQIYAMKGRIPEAVAAFANAYRFSRDLRQTHSYFLGLMATESDANLILALKEVTTFAEVAYPAAIQSEAAPVTATDGANR